MISLHAAQERRAQHRLVGTVRTIEQLGWLYELTRSLQHAPAWSQCAWQAALAVSSPPPPRAGPTSKMKTKSTAVAEKAAVLSLYMVTPAPPGVAQF